MQHINTSRILRLFLLLFTGIAFGLTGQAQFKNTVQREENGGIPIPQHADAAPGCVLTQQLRPTPPALWTVQFNHYASDSSSGQGAMAGVVYTGTEFWVSKWNSDTIFRFGSAGSYIGVFTVSGLTGVRAMTYDGTTVYAANNTSTVTKINPTTRLSAGTIAMPALTGSTNTGVRWITYSPTANAGAGGFYIGNWDTDIKLVSMTGSAISNITAATHTLTGMYGAAFDPLTTGGPFLWVFDQNSGGSAAQVVQLNATTGAPTGLIHDAATDVATGINGPLAGGLFFVPNAFVNGTNTLVGVAQGSDANGNPDNRLFGYEMAAPPPVDATVLSGMPTDALSKFPLNHAYPISFDGNIKNNGSSTLTSVSMNVTVKLAGNPVFNNTQTTTNLASYNDVILTSAGYTPTALGTYDVILTCSTSTGQPDPINNNDTVTFSFEVTDSTFAHDDGNYGTGGYFIQGGDAIAITSFKAHANDDISSVSFSFLDENPGDTAWAAVFTVSGGIPNYPPVATSLPLIQDGTTNDYTLPIPGGVSVSSGNEFAVGVYMKDSTGATTLKQSANFYLTGMNSYYTFASLSMIPSNIATARAIWANFGTPIAIGVVKSLPEGSTLTVFPNPSSGNFHVAMQLDQEHTFELSLLNAVGQKIKDIAGDHAHAWIGNIDMSELPAGIYYLQVSGGDFKETRKLVLVR